MRIRLILFVCVLLPLLMLSLFNAGCGSNTGDGANSELANGQDKTATRGNSLSAFELESRMVSQDGVFRFVACRASNLKRIASDRRDRMAENDTARLLEKNFKAAVSEFAEKRSLSGVEVDEIVSQHSALFQSLASNMSIESEFSVDLGNAFAAYLVATISHDEILLAVAPIIQQVGFSTTEQREFLELLPSTYTVGWAGNDSAFVVENWNDPQMQSTDDEFQK